MRWRANIWWLAQIKVVLWKHTNTHAHILAHAHTHTPLPPHSRGTVGSEREGEIRVKKKAERSGYDY